MRGDIRGNEIDFLQVQGFHTLKRHEDMAAVNRIKCAAEQADGFSLTHSFPSYTDPMSRSDMTITDDNKLL